MMEEVEDLEVILQVQLFLLHHQKVVVEDAHMDHQDLQEKMELMEKMVLMDKQVKLLF